MRRFLTYAASLVMALSMLTAPDMLAQSRSGGGSTTTRSTGSSSSSSSRSSGSSQQTTRSSGSSSQVSRSSSSSNNQQATRSSGSQQTTRSSGSSTTRSSGSSSQQVTRSSGSSNQQATRSSGSSGSSTTTRSSGSSSSVSSGSQARSSSSSSSTNTVSSSSQARSAGSSTTTTVQSSSSSNAQAVTGTTVRSSNVSRSGLTSSASQDSAPVNPTYRDNGYNYRYSDDMRVDDRHNMYRIAPRFRDPMPWDRAGYFWGDHPHYYGYRIHSLPPKWRRISHWGIDYYYYNGIYYRPFGGAYVVCRPPFGTPLEVAIDRALFHAIRFAYYCDTYRTYSRTFDYYNVIARQNLIIAQQNARLVARNSSYAINANRALSAYELANRLGLVQSYAYANSEYFYQDGVFYTISASGTVSTIVPPAGALVSSLPDDYEIIVMDGIEYYLVDNTVYRTTLFEGVPYLEVLGQMYGSLYTQYNVYR